jgi:nitrogen fixation NifU-like protein
MKYSPAVLERVRDPKHAGALPREERHVGTGEAGTLDEGTMTRIQVRVDPRTLRISDAVFKVFGCSAAIASASLVTERLQGAAVSAARAIEPLAVAAELELPIERAHVAALAVRAARSALDDWEYKRTTNDERRTTNDERRTQSRGSKQ